MSGEESRKMTRRCSHCSNDGHNSRTCPNRGVKIFGAVFDGGESIRKSASMGNLLSSINGGVGTSTGEKEKEAGYASEGFFSTKGSSSRTRERKKGMAWTEDEHRKFLAGLRTLGKGDWRGISCKFVVSRTPAQVASHAQKYFIRQSNSDKKNRRTSLFDMPDESGDAQALPTSSGELEVHEIIPLPALPPAVAEREPVHSDSNKREAEPPVPSPGTMPFMHPCPWQYPYPVMFSPIYPPYYPIPFPIYPCCTAETTENNAHKVFKPTAVQPWLASTDQLASMSTLNLREATGEARSSLAAPNPQDSGRHSGNNATT